MSSDIKELRKLKRSDLIEIIYEFQKKEVDFEEEIQELKDQLEDRRIAIEESGSIAEASLKLNEVFESAQKAADLYLEEIKTVHSQVKGKADELLDSAKKEAEETLSSAKKEAEEALSFAKEEAEELTRVTTETCSRMKLENEEAIKQQWESFSTRIGGVLKAGSLAEPDDEASGVEENEEKRSIFSHHTKY